MDEIDEQGIRIYELPDCDSDEDEEYVNQTKQLKVNNSYLHEVDIFVLYENGGLQVFSCFVRFLVKKKSDINSEKCIEYGK